MQSQTEDFTWIPVYVVKKGMENRELKFSILTLYILYILCYDNGSEDFFFKLPVRILLLTHKVPILVGLKMVNTNSHREIMVGMLLKSPSQK